MWARSFESLEAISLAEKVGFARSPFWIVMSFSMFASLNFPRRSGGIGMMIRDKNLLLVCANMAKRGLGVKSGSLLEASSGAISPAHLLIKFNGKLFRAK